jgi:hypothetical protein
MSNAKQFFKRAQAIAATALPLGPRAVLNLLNLRCNGSGVCWPAMKTIAREIGCTERSVQNHLAELIAAGFVELVRGGGRGLSNRYRLNLPVQNVENSSGFSDPEGEPNVENSSGFSGGGSVQNIETVAGNIEKFSLNTETVSIYPLRTTKKPIGGARNKFQKPNVEQVRQFAESNSLPISEAEPFCDHYESNGWRVGGRGPMRDWRAAFRNWCRRIPEFKRGAAAGPVGSSAAAAAWDSLRAAIKDHSAVEPDRVCAVVGKQAFNAARALVGLRRIESAAPSELPWLQAEFVRSFEGASS